MNQLNRVWSPDVLDRVHLGQNFQYRSEYLSVLGNLLLCQHVYRYISPVNIPNSQYYAHKALTMLAHWSISSRFSPSTFSIFFAQVRISLSTFSSSSSIASLIAGSISGSKFNHSSPNLSVKLISHRTAASLALASSDRRCSKIPWLIDFK